MNVSLLCVKIMAHVRILSDLMSAIVQAASMETYVPMILTNVRLVHAITMLLVLMEKASILVYVEKHLPD